MHRDDPSIHPGHTKSGADTTATVQSAAEPQPLTIGSGIGLKNGDGGSLPLDAPSALFQRRYHDLVRLFVGDETLVAAMSYGDSGQTLANGHLFAHSQVIGIDDNKVAVSIGGEQLPVVTSQCDGP